MTAPLWTSQAIAIATQASYSHDFDVTGVSIDTSTLNPGDLFIALKGPNFDGHDYVETAMAKGAAGILSDRPLDMAPYILVNNTQQGLTDLGKAARARFDGELIAITGSVGKTTTRALTAAAFKSFAKVHATTGNLNNHLGVPLTLARMPHDTQIAVIEMGMNHFGEISALSKLVKPTAAIITAIDWVHSENLDGSLEGVAKAKLEICDGLSGPLFAPTSIKSLIMPHMSEQEVRWIDAPYLGKLLLNGSAHAWNAALALATVPSKHQQVAETALSSVSPEPGRGDASILIIGDHEIELIDEAYNASPASMMASLKNLISSSRLRKIAVVGDMAELANPLKHHENLGNFLAENPVDMVIAVGKFHQSILNPLPSTILSMGFDSPKGVVPYLISQLLADDVVLVKASNSTGLGRIVADLKAAAKTQEA